MPDWVLTWGLNIIIVLLAALLKTLEFSRREQLNLQVSTGSGKDGPSAEFTARLVHVLETVPQGSLVLIRPDGLSVATDTESFKKEVARLVRSKSVGSDAEGGDKIGS